MMLTIWAPFVHVLDPWPEDLAKAAHHEWYKLDSGIYRASYLKGSKVRLHPDPERFAPVITLDIEGLWYERLPVPTNGSRWTRPTDLSICVVLRHTTHNVHVSHNGIPSTWSRWRFLAEWHPCTEGTTWDIVRRGGLRELPNRNEARR